MLPSVQRNRQPLVAAPINRAHPLASGLWEIVNPAIGTFGYGHVSGLFGVPHYSGWYPTTSLAQGGRVHNSAGAQLSDFYIPLPTYVPQIIPNTCSVFSLVYVGKTTQPSAACVATGYSGGGSKLPDIFINTANQVVAQCTDVDAGFQAVSFTTADSLSVGFHVIGWTFDKAKTLTIYVDGQVWLSQPFAVVGRAFYNMDEWKRPSVREYNTQPHALPNIGVSGAFFWVGRCLNQAEVQSFTRNPWSLIQPTPPMVAGLTSAPVTTPVYLDLTVNYAVLNSVQNDLTGTYGIMSAVQKDFLASYAILNSVQKDLTVNYAVLNAVQQSLTSSYAIANAVQQSLTGSYVVLNSVRQDLTATYAISNAVQASLGCSYAVMSAVQKDLAASYAIINSVQKDLTAVYGIAKTVSADLAGSYVISNSVKGDLTANYGICKPVFADLTAYYDILTSTSVGASLTCSYAILNSVRGDLVAAYSIMGSVQKDLAASYSVLNAVSGSLSANYIVMNRVQGSLTANYIVMNAVKADLNGAYSVLNSVSGDLTATYSIITATGGSVDPEAVAAAVWRWALESGFSAGQLMRLLASQAAGNASGLDSGDITFKSLNGQVDRIKGTVSGGQRTITHIDGS